MYSTKRRIAWGAAWGAVFNVLGFGLLGAGHGISTPLIVFTAPLSFLWGIALLGSIPFAALLACLAPRPWFPYVVLPHYVAAVLSTIMVDTHLDILLRPSTPRSFAILLGIVSLLYVAGHITLWGTWLLAREEARNQRKET